MGFLGNILSATVKTVILAPVAVAVDVVKVVSLEEPNNTTTVLGSAAEDTVNALTDLIEGDIV